MVAPAHLDLSSSDAASNSMFLLSGLLSSVGLLKAAQGDHFYTDTDYKSVRNIMMRFIGKNNEIITDLRTRFMETGGTGHTQIIGMTVRRQHSQQKIFNEGT